MPTVRSELAEYLRARRAAIRPEDVGYPSDPGRRVSGLRREEVADLAGISLEYYVRLEQGHGYQMSEQVLGNLSRALMLDVQQAAFFYRLALPAPPFPRPGRQRRISETVMQLVEQWSHVPLYVFDRNQDILVANALAQALLPTVAVAGNNIVLSAFAAPAEGRGLDGWKAVAHSSVAALRFHGDPADARLQEIVGGLSVKDEDFRQIWADYDARPLNAGVAPIFVEGYGFGEFPWQTLEIPDGQFMTVWVAPGDTFAGRAIRFLQGELEAAQGLAPAALSLSPSGSAALGAERAVQADRAKQADRTVQADREAVA